MIIAIDGPSGAGKSTVAKLVSAKLDFIYIDTGAMYRALAYKATKYNIEICREKVDEMLKDTKIDYIDNCIYLDGENVNEFIRDESISKASSKISALENVRRKMVQLQRNIAENKSVIMDGRDIGTVVFPDADFKFFITASVDERAQRRYKEIVSSQSDVDYKDVLFDIIKRDKCDSSREISPLMMAEDAVLIDTTAMGIGEVVEYIVNSIGGDHVL
jgi:cytidylate kinase